LPEAAKKQNNYFIYQNKEKKNMNLKKIIVAVSALTIALCAIFHKSVQRFIYHLPIYFKYVRKEKKVDDHHVETTLFNGYKIIVNSDDGCVCRRVRGFGIWEPHEVKVLKDILKTGMRVVEIGANYGTHTLYISELVGPTGQVIAFECNPFVSSKLKKSLEINNIANCILKEIAVSDHAYDTFIVYNLDNIGAGYILSEEDAKTFNEKSSTLHHKISVTTLDTELKDVHDIDL
jgi:FkbM family methyltransferase